MNGILPAVSEGWMDQAECLGITPDRMQPDYASRHELEDIKANVCGVCPVRRECLESAGRQDEPYGLWGGVWHGEDPAWLDHTCENPECGKEFVREPNRPTRYCPPCGKKIKREKTKARNAARRSREKVPA